MRRYIVQCTRRRTDGREDADAATKLLAMVEGCVLNTVLEELYPLECLFVEYMPKQILRLMALALDPRLVALASIIVLIKKLLQGTRLGFEKDLDG